MKICVDVAKFLIFFSLLRLCCQDFFLSALPMSFFFFFIVLSVTLFFTLTPFCEMYSTRSVRIVKNKRVGVQPYCVPKVAKGTKKHSSKVSSMDPRINDPNVLEINVDAETDRLLSDSDNSASTQRRSTVSDHLLAKDEMLSLLKEIRDSQSSLRNDFQSNSQVVSERLTDMDVRVTSNASSINAHTSSINAMSSRINKVESAIEDSRYENELMKQSAISKNLSVVGIPPLENEELVAIVMKICSQIGHNLRRQDIFGCYRVMKGRSQTDVIIVKLNDFSVKHQVLKLKASKVVRLHDFVLTSDQNPMIYVNNHVTPFFGKLLSEGRKAMKEKKIHSVWLSRDGCRMRLEDGGKEFIYRSIKDLNSVISRGRVGDPTNVDGNSNKKKRNRQDDDDVLGSPSGVHKAKK